MNDDSYVFRSKAPTAHELEARAPDRYGRFLEWARAHRCSGCSSLVLVLTVDTCFGGGGWEHHVHAVCPLRWPLPLESCYLHGLVGLVDHDGFGKVDLRDLDRWEVVRAASGPSNYLRQASGGRQPVELPDWVTALARGSLEEQVEVLAAAARVRHGRG